MKSILLFPAVAALVLSVSVFAWWQVSEQAEREKWTAECTIKSELVIAEFDAIVAKGKFPTQEQQDHWVVMTRGCE